jgi:hypothetical protein
MPNGPGYGAGIVALISASPGFQHFVDAAEDVQDWLSAGPDGAAVTVTVGGAGVGWLSAAAGGAAAMAAAAAHATNAGVMSFNPIRMVAPLSIGYLSVTCHSRSTAAAAEGATEGSTGLAALRGPLWAGVGTGKSIIDFDVASLFAFRCAGAQTGADLGIGHTGGCGGDRHRDGARGHPHRHDRLQSVSHNDLLRWRG